MTCQPENTRYIPFPIAVIIVMGFAYISGYFGKSGIISYLLFWVVWEAIYASGRCIRPFFGNKCRQVNGVYPDYDYSIPLALLGTFTLTFSIFIHKSRKLI